MSSRVLLVEDNPDDEALTLRALRKSKLPIEVLVARDGAEALDLLGINEPATPNASLPNLVLLDIKMPKVNGLDVLRSIRKSPKTRSLPVVMLTSSDEPSDVISASMLNVARYLRKPVDYDEFMISMDGLIADFLTPEP